MSKHLYTYDEQRYYQCSIGDDAMAEKIRVNFNLDKDVHMQVKKLALEKNTTATALYTKWTLEAIERETGQTRFNVE